MIDERIISQIHDVSEYAEDCDDWVTIKKEIMKGIPSSMRSNFSRRDSITKNQVPNDFDLEVINYYKDITGIQLVIRTLEERKKIES
jgi:hypothetical protein